jgi:hypothetical protein
MKCSRSTSRWAIGVLTLVLLLQSAVPLLASLSARLQGKQLVEVCTVYGVATVALDGSSNPAPASEHPTSHGTDRCALTTLLAHAFTEPPVALAGPVEVPACCTWQPVLAAPVPHATARWLALLHHGPPGVS